ncbi:plant UBX domain-containing protein 1-like [Zingiber officinale]|uniref:plant UBX domain-containing protein 1-like n=1 Tax=Zingiber officinale TaxID=94328 RepID=UPI001C4D4296|nr:plant UBX domain-containing protein 1-like [Zingiber officinale]XP_042394825.1 plant UBX domain-containing protein 1-like [Zingiber officinale]XP_042394826.1 plant UBX domain-containing protein 1-like [Zingiber officinale]XP_042394827.1 plant UBX domain-containing protein 1-like [Zingiber officinale]
MDAQQAKAKLLAVEKELGHAVRVFTNTASFANPGEISSSSTEEPDEFYEFTPDDYYRIMSDRIGAQSQILKTRKMREAEKATRRAKVTKAVIRVRFPDKYVLEAKFQPSETLQSLMDLLKKVVARPDLPFYIYTTPPKERVKDTSKDFYSAGFAPGAIVYFSYDLPKDLESDDSKEGPYLRDDILSLNGLDLPIDRVDPAHPEEELKGVQIPSSAPDPKPPAKKPAKPKWLKL